MLCIIRNVILLVLLVFSINVFAKQNDEVKNTCEVSGGQFTETASGNWACCWPDWGCYGCVGGICKIKCYNERCRKANDTVRPDSGVKTIKGLAPAGGKDPMVPVLNKNKNSKARTDSIKKN